MGILYKINNYFNKNQKIIKYKYSESEIIDKFYNREEIRVRTSFQINDKDYFNIESDNEFLINKVFYSLNLENEGFEFFNAGTYGCVYHSIKYPKLCIKLTSNENDYLRNKELVDVKIENYVNIYASIKLVNSTNRLLGYLIIKEFVDNVNYDINDDISHLFGKYDFKFYMIEDYNNFDINSISKEHIQELSSESLKLFNLFVNQFDSFKESINQLNEIQGNNQILDVHSQNFSINNDGTIKIFDAFM